MLSRWVSFGQGHGGLVIQRHPTPSDGPTSYPILDKSAALYITRRISILNFPRHHSTFELSALESRAQQVSDNLERVLRAAFGKDVGSERFSAGLRYAREIIFACRDEGTHLSPMGKITASKLMFHGYMSAMSNLKILDDAYPLMLTTPRLDDFTALAEGKRREQVPRVAG